MRNDDGGNLSVKVKSKDQREDKDSNWVDYLTAPKIMELVEQISSMLVDLMSASAKAARVALLGGLPKRAVLRYLIQQMT